MSSFEGREISAGPFCLSHSPPSRRLRSHALAPPQRKALPQGCIIKATLPTGCASLFLQPSPATFSPILPEEMDFSCRREDRDVPLHHLLAPSNVFPTFFSPNGGGREPVPFNLRSFSLPPFPPGTRCTKSLSGKLEYSFPLPERTKPVSSFKSLSSELRNNTLPPLA